MNLPSILLWGFVATVMLTTIIVTGVTLGITRIDMPLIIGTMFTSDRDRAKVYGYVFHLLNGLAFALLYAVLFESLHKATWWLGAIIGLVQGFVVIVIFLPLLPGLHPRMV